MAERIPLTQGQVAFVDPDDYKRIAAHKWCAQWNRKTNSFIAVRADNSSGKRSTLLMHRSVLDAPHGQFVDHISHDTLDNRRSNLRLCSNSQNSRNQLLRSSNSSWFKGVHWLRQNRCWRASITVDRKTIHLGCFASADAAAEAYDVAAVRYFGEFALTNKEIALLKGNRPWTD